MWGQLLHNDTFYELWTILYFCPMNAEIANLRKDYSSESLLETDVDNNPLDQFEKWWKQAINSQIDEANAMTLATASSDGIPAARIVLLKGFNKEGFIFFTNYESYKAIHLEENPKACLVFFWKELERQVRITGLVKKLSATDNDEYFLEIIDSKGYKRRIAITDIEEIEPIKGTTFMLKYHSSSMASDIFSAFKKGSSM